MALNNEMLEVVETVIQTEDDLKSFQQGYLLGLDGTRDVRFEGQALPQFFGGLRLSYLLDVSEVEMPPADSEEFIPGKPSGYTEEPAFVLGAALAACKLKREGHVQESWTDTLGQQVDG
jgi:hypothetical protein